MGFFTALAFLTIIPVPHRGMTGTDRPSSPFEPESYARSVPYFPLVGLLLGLILVGFDFLLGLAFQPLVVNALLVVLTLVLTGALHFEGFIDSCDGLLCTKSPEQRLEIMKDSRVGAFGVAGAGALIILRFAALVSLPVPLRPYVLLLAPVLSRWSMAWALTVFPYGRSGPGVGKIFKDYLEPRAAVYATAVALILAGAIWQVSGLAVAAVAAFMTLLVAKFALSRIPGLTGDVYGAINEVSEVAILLVAPMVVVLNRLFGLSGWSG